ncbi:MAG: hypothetical protein IKJ58_00460 [Akkermansia sp.]|nr:hypothetical protein [Akkermansia sp.]
MALPKTNKAGSNPMAADAIKMPPVAAPVGDSKKGSRLSKLKVASAEVKQVEPEGPLYYILPPLLVLIVIIFCYAVESPAAGKSAGNAPAQTSSAN